MALSKRLRIIHDNIKEALNEDVGTQAVSNVDDFGLDGREEHKTLQEAIQNYVKLTTDYTIKLKTHLNALVFINKLPVELLIHIFLLTNPPHDERLRCYIEFTSVCHYWRSVLVQSANFWTSVQLYLATSPINPFIHEVLSRSKSAKLDIRIRVDCTLYLPLLEDMLAKESYRIDTLCLVTRHTGPIELFAGGTRFPSLRRVVSRVMSRDSCPGLLPIAMASDHLEVFDCNLNITANTLNRLSPVLVRTPNLNIHVSSTGMLQSLLNVLRRNVELRSLQLQTKTLTPFTFSNQTILPGVLFLSTNNVSLLQGVRTPKLSSLNVDCFSPITSNNPVFEGFNFSLIKYLHIYHSKIDHTEHSIVGLTEPLHPKSTLWKNYEDLAAKICSIQDIEELVDHMENIFSDAWPRGCFRLKCRGRFDWMLNGALPFVLPRMTNISELCLATDSLLEYRVSLGEFLAQLPSLDKLVVLDDHELDYLIEFLRNTSVCPRLKHVSFTISRFDVNGYDQAELAEKVGEALSSSVQSRREAYDGALRYIALGRCPPIPECWATKLHKLGTTVVTEKNINIVLSSILKRS